MSEQTPPPSNALELYKARISVELTKAGINYQKLLQAAEDIVFTTENLLTAGEPIAALRKAKTELEKQENPHTAAWKAWNEARGSLVKPIEDTIARKTKEYTAKNNEVVAARNKKLAEDKRKEDIKTAITNFTLEYSTKIAGATTNDELVALQKRIGAEKSRSTFYQEFMPDLFKAVEGLEEALKTQKEHVKGLEAAKALLEKAKEQGDDETVVEMLANLGVIQEKIEETKTEVQEFAINQATAFTPQEPEEVLPAAAKARRTTWEWKITDIALFQRRHPELVELVPNKAKIDAIIKERRESKTLSPVAEDGWEIYKKEHL